MKPQSQIFSATAITLVFLAVVSCSPKEGKLLLEPSQALGTVLAGETVQAAGTKKQIVLILPQWAAGSTAGESFKAALKRQAVTIAFTVSANVGDPMGRSPVGLKAADFLNALEKGGDAGAIVSLAGAPLLNAQDAAQLSSGHPPVLVVATRSLGDVIGVPGDGSYLAKLLDAKIIQLAIVDGGDQANAKSSGKLDATHQSFFQHYTILRSQN